MRSTVFVVFVAAAVVVLITAGSVLSSLATPPRAPRCASVCLPDTDDTDNTAPVMLVIGILMVSGGVAMLIGVRRLHRRDRDRDRDDHHDGW